jgi:hypothetical protein
MSPHPGIRIDHIDAAEGGGLIFAVGMVVLFWLAVPAFRPLVIACVVLGALYAPIFHRGHP